jgi:hypothetical protein
MWALGTGLVVTAVLGVGVAAAVDALPESAGHPAGRTGAGMPSIAGARGTITYSDQGCRLHALRLPSLRRVRAPTIESCEPHVPTGGIGAWKGDVVWAGFGYQTVQLILSKRELTRALRGLGGESAGGYSARQAVALAGGRYAVLAAASEAEWQRVLVLLAERRVVATVSFGDEAQMLRPSPGGRYVAVISRRGPGLRVFTRGGRAVRLPRLRGAHAIAWSPDERWTAIATRTSIFVFQTARPAGQLVRIPRAARDLDWGA